MLEFRCYEAKIEESERPSAARSQTQDTWLEPPVPLSHDMNNIITCWLSFGPLRNVCPIRGINCQFRRQRYLRVFGAAFVEVLSEMLLVVSQEESHVAQTYWCMETALWWSPRATVSAALLVAITGATNSAILLLRRSLNTTPGTTFLWSPRETTVQVVFWKFHSPLSAFSCVGTWIQVFNVWHASLALLAASDKTIMAVGVGWKIMDLWRRSN